ncbi:MAG: hypothetical protein HQ579_01805 [Candidatus Omnitrophica bacterium]|nr:hypothetical protein [Candidatus Omnitrophota bacterium]
MFRNAIIIITVLFVSLFTLHAFAALEFYPEEAQVKVIAGRDVTILTADSPKASISELGGGTVDISYYPESRSLDATASLGATILNYYIAKAFLDEGESVHLASTTMFRAIRIKSLIGEVTVVFPDDSRIVMAEGAVAFLTRLADNNYQLAILEGSARYTEVHGEMRTLNSASPVVFVQGFTAIPGWRSIDTTRNPATP